MKPFVVGISGPSCSGKTIVAKRFALLAPEEIPVVRVDSYYRDLSSIPPEERESVNFDSPSAIDFDLLVDQLNGIIEGEEVHVPVYDFSSHERRAVRESLPVRLPAAVGRRSVLVVEGLHLLGDPRMRPIIEFFVFIDADLETCLHRRLKRDTVKRGRTEDSIIRRFNENVIPMYRRYILPLKDSADMVIDGRETPEDSAAKIFEKVSELIGG